MATIAAKIKKGPAVSPSMIDPAVYRPLKGRLRVRVPAGTTRSWIRDACAPNSQPEPEGGPVWLVARAHMHPLTQALAVRHGFCDVWIDFRSNKKCDIRCVEARGESCDCSCLGQNHAGGLFSDWILVGETTLVASEVIRVQYRVESVRQVSRL